MQSFKFEVYNPFKTLVFDSADGGSQLGDVQARTTTGQAQSAEPQRRRSTELAPSTQPTQMSAGDLPSLSSATPSVARAAAHLEQPPAAPVSAGAAPQNPPKWQPILDDIGLIRGSPWQQAVRRNREFEREHGYPQLPEEIARANQGGSWDQISYRLQRQLDTCETVDQFEVVLASIVDLLVQSLDERFGEVRAGEPRGIVLPHFSYGTSSYAWSRIPKYLNELHGAISRHLDQCPAAERSSRLAVSRSQLFELFEPGEDDCNGRLPDPAEVEKQCRSGHQPSPESMRAFQQIKNLLEEEAECREALRQANGEPETKFPYAAGMSPEQREKVPEMAQHLADKRFDAAFATALDHHMPPSVLVGIYRQAGSRLPSDVNQRSWAERVRLEQTVVRAAGRPASPAQLSESWGVSGEMRNIYLPRDSRICSDVAGFQSVLQAAFKVGETEFYNYFNDKGTPLGFKAGVNLVAASQALSKSTVIEVLTELHTQTIDAIDRFPSEMQDSLRGVYREQLASTLRGLPPLEELTVGHKSVFGDYTAKQQIALLPEIVNFAKAGAPS